MLEEEGFMKWRGWDWHRIVSEIGTWFQVLDRLILTILNAFSDSQITWPSAKWFGDLK
jgi:hypothetical protein